MTSPHRVLLVDPPHGLRIREPLGLGYLAGMLRARDVPVRILSESIPRKVTDDRLMEMAEGSTVVGFSSTSPNFLEAVRMAGLVKRRWPATRVVLGGYHGTMVHEVVLERHPEIDAVVRSEGEYAFAELLDAMARGPLGAAPIASVSHRSADGAIVVGPSRPPIKDLDALARPARDLMPPPKDFPRLYEKGRKRALVKATVASSRGCPYFCNFCSIISFYDESRFRWRAPEAVADEIEELMTGYGVECIHFCDDNFLVSPRRAKGIFAETARRGLDVVFRFNTRADQLVRAKHVLPDLVRCGLAAIEIGIENGSQAALDRIGKGTKVEHNVEALQMLDQLGIAAEIDFILFDPFTTVEELEDNLVFFNRHLPWGFPTQKAVFSALTLYPGTAAHEQAVAAKLYGGDPHLLPSRVFQDSEVDEIYDFLSRCQDEAGDMTDRAEVAGRDILIGVDRLGEAEKRKTLAEFTLANVPLNRLALKLFEKTLVLKRSCRGRVLPAGDMDRMRARYLDETARFSRDLQAIHRRMFGERAATAEVLEAM